MAGLRNGDVGAIDSSDNSKQTTKVKIFLLSQSNLITSRPIDFVSQCHIDCADNVSQNCTNSALANGEHLAIDEQRSFVSEFK